MWMNMNSMLEEKEEGPFKLSKFSIDEKDFRAMLSGIPVGNYIRLTKGHEVVMSDTDMEKRTNQYFVEHAYGDVLIGGLGIGMIIMAIQDNPAVTSITIIEKHQEVINMIATQLKFNDKVTIIQADVFTWKPDRKYDVIYMDIWNYINKGVYQKEMIPLKRKFSKYLKPREVSPSRFNKCWAELEAKHGRRLY